MSIRTFEINTTTMSISSGAPISVHTGSVLHKNASELDDFLTLADRTHQAGVQNIHTICKEINNTAWRLRTSGQQDKIPEEITASFDEGKANLKHMIAILRIGGSHAHDPTEIDSLMGSATKAWMGLEQHWRRNFPQLITAGTDVLDKLASTRTELEEAVAEAWADVSAALQTRSALIRSAPPGPTVPSASANSVQPPT